MRQTIYKPTSVGQSADGRRLLEHLTISKDNIVNLFETIVLHFRIDMDRLYFVKLNIYDYNSGYWGEIMNLKD